MAVCPKCNNEVPSESAFCNRCGFQFTSNSSLPLTPAPRATASKRKAMIFLVVIIASVALLGIAISKANSIHAAAALESQKHRTSEVSEQHYSALCSPLSSCDGKFIVWKGVVLGDAPTGASNVTIETIDSDFDANQFDVQLDRPLGGVGVHAGDEILFHGILHGDDSISNGYVRTTLATASQRKLDIDRREKAAAAKAAAEASAQDSVAASRMGVNVQNYQNAKSNIEWISASCQNALIKQNEWGGEADLSDYSWRVEGNSVILDGRDVELKNGFGAEGRVSYECVYDLTNRSAVAVVQ